MNLFSTFSYPRAILCVLEMPRIMMLMPEFFMHLQLNEIWYEWISKIVMLDNLLLRLAWFPETVTWFWLHLISVHIWAMNIVSNRRLTQSSFWSPSSHWKRLILDKVFICLLIAHFSKKSRRPFPVSCNSVSLLSSLCNTDIKFPTQQYHFKPFFQSQICEDLVQYVLTLFGWQ